nr:phosphonopyruvate decarboxylase [Kibdelosporangium sp. MJ126-NF4]CEL18021.1 Phosphonopyruvate decarboxylase [Kibdelosporangium sp. MJ126-NF4]CTQ90751.1 Phosphonopyruvate decarboxylase (EC 4.1.1.82) [Kibdelosporangium sp. MJ126-NF4]
MISAQSFVDQLDEIGVRSVAGVPCSYLAGPTALLGSRYLAAANEGSALAIAAGGRLGGHTGGVFVQNSGFGNLINPLTSLVLPYRIPVVVAMTMRGWPQADPGEPQHYWMGQVVPQWLDSMKIPYWLLTADTDRVPDVRAALDDGLPAFLLVGKGAIGKSDTQAEVRPGPSRADVVKAVLDATGGDFVLSTTGYLSRELFNQEDRDTNFYMQGSMGHVAAVALGAARARPDRRHVVLDGDGSMLMHMGTLATIGHYGPANLRHIVVDNGTYESTGGQPTTADTSDLPGIARSCGYRTVATAGTPEELTALLRTAQPGPVFIHVPVAPSPAPAGRASEKITPPQMATRFAEADR